VRVLIIEDDPAIAEAVSLMLSIEGLNTSATQLGEEGFELGRLYDYDIILLDLDLPDLHGHDVLKKLRCAKVQTPIVIVSGDCQVETKLRSFGLGADDYITKPFRSEELVARIRAVARRAKGLSEPIVRTGKLEVNLDTQTAVVEGASIYLTKKEYETLELLSLRKGATLTPEMFLDHLYGGIDEPNAQIVDVYICKLRKKLAIACGGEDYIKTVRARGYALIDPPSLASVTQGKTAANSRAARPMD
jgi:two-component system, cell cycle response regulator CtrA